MVDEVVQSVHHPGRDIVEADGVVATAGRAIQRSWLEPEAGSYMFYYSDKRIAILLPSSFVKQAIDISLWGGGKEPLATFLIGGIASSDVQIS